ncbi:hypothetical protein DET54_11182 [Paenibacillus pabuli]|uniref:Uncharacterized protein n=1 Tax=Paenibacillus pabuli TaxID=1472 RepID=A0A855Y3M8_9BACL|nr:hypothetical protein DET56_11379 [Paenibacillus pabuli]PXW01833.1 hypothetical protein DEU73_11278 [Paenibacillus taichungensis]RAI91763.1 hypothetical protein DET54_11182 [Paenibacillus pabuli]
MKMKKAAVWGSSFRSSFIDSNYMDLVNVMEPSF